MKDIKLIKIITNGFVWGIVALSMYWLGRDGFKPVLPLYWHLVFHNVGVVMFLGSIVMSLIWALKTQAAQSDRLILFVISNISSFDNWLIKPGVLLIVLNGLYLSYQWGGVFSQAWIYMSMLMFILSGLVWGLKLIPLQKRILAVSDNVVQDNEQPLASSFKAWLGWAILATLLPLIAFMLMLIKPGL